MNRRSQDLRGQSDRRYLLLVIATLVLAGGLLIALIYGWPALLAALPLLLAGASLILLPWLALLVLERLRDRAERG